MSVRVMSWVWDHSQAGGTDRLVLLAIADSADHDGTNAWPAVATIARKCQVSERTVQRSIRSLEALGEVEVLAQQGGHAAMTIDRRPNLYRVVMRGVTDRHPAADGVTDRHPGGDQVTPRGVTPLSPNPSLDPSKTEPLPAPKGAEEDPERGFEVWWERYPRRNGKRLGRAKCLAKWRAFSLDTKRLVYGATVHYAAAVEAGSTIAKDPERFLAARYWEGWLDGPGEAAQDAPPASPADGTAKAARGLEERTRRVQAGEACPLCQDAGIVLGEDDLARPCSCRKAS